MFLALLAVAASISLPQGETRIFEARELGIKSPVSSAFFAGKPVPIFKRGGKTYLLIAADVAKSLGDYPLRVVCAQESENLLVAIKRGNFRTVLEKSTYKPSTLSPEVRAVKEAERRPMLQALKQGEPERIWQNTFLRPLSVKRVSGEFGLRRVYPNHVSIHRGVDLVPENSRVVTAISEAHVLYAGDTELYLEGKTVILDHGQGIISIYLHLSEVRVKTGDNVVQGKDIGLAGSTGNSTGMHLHFAITLAGSHVDPLKFINVFQNLK